MRTSAKMGLIAAGYVAALAVAGAAVAVNASWTAGPGRQASSGMSAFGDSLLFLAVFGAAAVPPTVGALVFLRPYPRFWRVLAIAAVVTAATGLASLAICVATRTAVAGSAIQSSSALAVLRILAAPLFALAFLVSGVVAPRWPARIALCAATVSEVVAFAAWLLLLPR
jgi:hypothetical protein